MKPHGKSKLGYKKEEKVYGFMYLIHCTVKKTSHFYFAFSFCYSEKKDRSICELHSESR